MKLKLHVFISNRSVFMLFRLLAFGHELLEGGRGHVHRCRRHLVRHCSDRNVGPPHEDVGQQAHHHGRPSLRDASADVVRVRIPDLDDVGCRNFSLNF